MYAREVYDLYEWLPPHGESGVFFHFYGVDLYLHVRYESEIEEKIILMERDIIFLHTVDLRMAAFPGAQTYLFPDSFNRIDFKNIGIDTLNEIVDSVFSKKWDEHFNNIFSFRHFNICFVQENREFEIIAEDFSVSEPVFIGEKLSAGEGRANTKLSSGE